MRFTFKMESCVEASRNVYISVLAEIFAEKWKEKFEERFRHHEKKNRETTEKVLQTVIGLFSVHQEMESNATENATGKRGRPKKTQLLGNFKNSKVCSWFDRVRRKFKKSIENLAELMVCFFCALFDVVSSEESYGKVCCFHRLMKDHLNEDIPSLRMLQNKIRWLKEWGNGFLSWTNKEAERKVHDIWERLRQKIKEELLRLEPRLAVAY